MTVTFLFAHQDDEIGVFHELQQCVRRGEHVVCIYLTDGSLSGRTARRNLESRTVLRALGVPSADVFFAGAEAGITDGRLVEHLEQALHIARACVPPGCERIIMHAWEGGHQDHDAVHLIGLALAADLGILSDSRQFPLYRPPSRGVWLRFADPLAANGPVDRHRIPILDRLRFLLMLRHYPSQWRVMARLAPPLAWDYLTGGCQKLQPIGLRPIARMQPPTGGATLYEIWRMYSFVLFSAHAQPFVRSHLSCFGTSLEAVV
jgi:LmbE family N-acetylglucosaminyl deacetylase